MSKKTSGIYKITNKLTDDVYIGKSINIGERIRDHKNKLEKSKHKNQGLQRDYNTAKRIKPEYEIFKYEVIEEVRDESTLGKKEFEYIKKYNSSILGYNNTLGGKYDIQKETNELIGMSKIILANNEIIIKEKLKNLNNPNIKYSKELICALSNKEVDKGRVYTRLGKYNEATPFFEESLKINPKNYYCYQELGHHFYLRKNYDKALEYCNKSLEINPKNAVVYRYKKDIYMRLLEYEKAIKCVEKYYEFCPTEDFEEYFKIEISNIKEDLKLKQKKENRLEKINETLKSNPNNKTFLYEKAEILRDLNRGNESINTYDEILEKYLDNKPAFIYKIDTLIEFDRLDEALNQINEKLDNNPKEYKYLNLKNKILLKNRNYQEALDNVEYMLKIENIKNNPSKYKILLKNKISLLIRIKKFDDALKYCNEFLEIDPLNTRITYNKIQILIHSFKFDDALETCNKFLEKKSSSIIEGRKEIIIDITKNFRKEKKEQTTLFNFK